MRFKWLWVMLMNKKIISLFIVMFIIIAIQGFYIYQFSQQINSLSDTVSSLRFSSDISELDRRIDNLDRRTSSNESKISMLNDDISDVDSRLNNVVLYLNAGFYR